ncbi:hypothetical protein U27_05419 [Candidatus Vecturithrix granuli]|uniref:Uncharacterized protein n=1 Tax=Vecturithrix granuli TaxID=1499967 RepID=A0A081C1J0_VECG1|nr:hypothetical protein U27_05419 [Candidatus Vecturithrix granuli]
MEFFDFDIEIEADKLLILLITTDLLFMAFHIFHVFHTSIGLFYDVNFSLQQEQGFAEVFQYLKEYWATLLLAILAVRTKNLLYVSWMLLFGYFLVDDAFGVHEVLGEQLGQTLGNLQLFGLQASDLGELFVSGFFGILFFIAIGVTYRVNDEEAKHFSRYFFTMLIILLLFGVATSIVKRLSPDATWQFILGTVEESGEMLVMSVIIWFLIGFNPESI